MVEEVLGPPSVLAADAGLHLMARCLQVDVQPQALAQVQELLQRLAQVLEEVLLGLLLVAVADTC